MKIPTYAATRYFIIHTVDPDFIGLAQLLIDLPEHECHCGNLEILKYLRQISDHLTTIEHLVDEIYAESLEWTADELNEISRLIDCIQEKWIIIRSHIIT